MRMMFLYFNNFIYNLLWTIFESVLNFWQIFTKRYLDDFFYQFILIPYSKFNSSKIVLKKSRRDIFFNDCQIKSLQTLLFTSLRCFFTSNHQIFNNNHEINIDTFKKKIVKNSKTPLRLTVEGTLFALVTRPRHPLCVRQQREERTGFAERCNDSTDRSG